MSKPEHARRKTTNRQAKPRRPGRRATFVIVDDPAQPGAESATVAVFYHGQFVGRASRQPVVEYMERNGLVAPAPSP